MKSMKRGLAVLLAVLLMIPILPAKVEAASISGGDELNVDYVNSNVNSVASESIAEEVTVNTGNFAFRVTDPSVSDNIIGDTFFEEDGSYTINIPEANPFFPYEVQFTCDGEVTTEWFMTPDDSVEVGGHTFYVSAYFDGTVMTQLTLDVAGKEVVVYPEAKEFTNDGGIMLLSLQPLYGKVLNVDLSGFTPAELTMVSVDTLFAGTTAVTDTDKIIWRTENDAGDYVILSMGDKIDLSRRTSSGFCRPVEMIVGEVDQLATDNIRYVVDYKVDRSNFWLTPTVYAQDTNGVRTQIKVVNYEYHDSYNDKDNRQLDMLIYRHSIGSNRNVYLGLAMNPEVFATPSFASYKVYEGKYATVAEAMAAKDITEQLFASDMSQVNAGYCMSSLYNDPWFTLVTFDAAGNATGCLPFYISGISTTINGISSSGPVLVVENENSTTVETVANISSFVNSDGCSYVTYSLYKDYPANAIYHKSFEYFVNNTSSPESVTAAYVGNYNSIAETSETGATDIKADLFKTHYGFGYAADYSQGVYFTIFIGADGTIDQKIYKYNIKIEEDSLPAFDANSVVSNLAAVSFDGLVDADGNTVAIAKTDVREDSYAEYNYLTLLVNEDVDLSKLAPTFYLDYNNMKLYASGSSTPEVSGESYHDFSKGPVQYTAAAEDGDVSKNYWLQVVKPTTGAGQLYINSFADPEAETKVENGITYSTRAMMLDGYHQNVHDIWVANMGTEAIEKLSVELVSDTVELDGYWTLNGNYELSGFKKFNYHQTYDLKMSNLAKVRIKAKAGVADATEVTGTLTFKSGEKTLVVLNLTGTVGDPAIVTDSIPEAVKYVPYGTMIQNSNKYSWNKVSYKWIDGNLPDGMVIKSNGEIYGVPTETGEFTFTMRLDNSHGSFEDSEATFTLKVIENTDANVDAATDTGYDLTQRVQGLDVDAGFDENGSQTLVSQGVYAEFVDIYLDGRKLVAGTDYTSESGSTRITILNQTLADVEDNESGIHTLGVEFRTEGDVLKRAAQNYSVKSASASEDGSGENGSQEDGVTEDNDSSEDKTDADGTGSSDDDDDSDDKNSDSKGGNKPAGNKTGTMAGTTTQPQYTQLNVIEGAVTHTVVSGDTLWSIAEKYLGNGANWNKIYEDNKNAISDPNSIYVGQVLIINVEGGNMATGTGPLAGTNTYVVQSGDTLWKIADNLYGKGWKWRTIYEANKNVVADPESIYAGQVLVIP